MKRITIREYEKISVVDAEIEDADCLTRAEARSLIELASRLAKPELPAALNWSSDVSIAASSIVGVLSDGHCLVEILPKTDRQNADDQRLDLIGMIARTLNLQIDSQAVSSMRWDAHSDFVEILVHAFLDELVEQTRRGLPRQYVALEDDLTRLRGRIDVIRQFTTLASTPQKIACRFDELSPDIPLNQGLKVALLIASRLTRLTEARRLALEARMFFEPVASVSVDSLRLDRVQFDRTNARFARLFALACLLIEGFRQTAAVSQRQGFALLFDMNILFEQFVGSCYRASLAGTGWKVFLQGPKRYALRDLLTGSNKVLTIPDISLRRDDGLTLIVDTKWKRYEPDDGHRVSNSDVYQMIAYSVAHGAGDTVLLYPHLASLGSEPGVQQSLEIVGGIGRVHFATVDLRSIKAVPSALTALLNAIVPIDLAA